MIILTIFLWALITVIAIPVLIAAFIFSCTLVALLGYGIILFAAWIAYKVETIWSKLKYGRH
jgi:hypothetical protein